MQVSLLLWHALAALPVLIPTWVSIRFQLAVSIPAPYDHSTRCVGATDTMTGITLVVQAKMTPRGVLTTNSAVESVAAASNGA